jgi:hypothetical protein
MRYIGNTHIAPKFAKIRGDGKLNYLINMVYEQYRACLRRLKILLISMSTGRK